MDSLSWGNALSYESSLIVMTCPAINGFLKERLEYLESMLGDSADKHAKAIGKIDERMDGPTH